ncbi:hypothetical protein Poli38472_007947 [Pythium oligandrum]|uniref:Uncharacterized protein n=1 Tax=Pythium oligandrum TaxID=41045 RepID=A0A8K1CL77_PYTOL|nr:hypothetical protein Poli38472_007947 [Pythium oligandrum]|eukprot:TMW65305.1 hypothetical protein Poli38472_007947 [Pythium oligandrum]
MPRVLQGLRARYEALQAWVHSTQYLGRYSIEKLHLFEHYQRTASSLRVVAVICLAPLPTFLALLAMDIVPMNDPHEGASHNAVAFIRSTLSHGLMTAMTLLPLKQALSLTDDEYAYKTIAVIAVLTSLTIEAVCIPLAFLWRFPLPFREMIGLPIWATSVATYNYLFAKKTLFRHWRRFKRYLPIVGVQLVVLYLWLGCSIGFAYLSLLPQILVIIAFPLLKVSLKSALWKYARRLDDISTDVTICLLEISGALFQTVCMQYVTSKALNALVMVTDLVQAVHEVRAHMKMDYLGDGKRTLLTARKIIESSVFPGHSVGDGEAPLRRKKTQSSDTNRDDGMASEVGQLSIRRRSSRLLLRSSDDSTSPLSTRHRDNGGASAASTPRGFGEKPRRQMRMQANSVYIPAQTVYRKSKRRLLDLDKVRADDLSGGRDSDPGAAEQSAVNIPIEALTSPPASGPRRRSSLPTTIQRGGSLVRIRLTASIKNPRIRLFCSSSVSKHTPPAFTEIEKPPEHSRHLARVHPVTAADIPSTQSPPLRLRAVQYAANQLEEPKPRRPSIQKAAELLRRRSKRGSAVIIDGIIVARPEQARILEQTLQLLFACEVLLFAEYMEVVIPFLYALCLGCDWVLPNGQYNLIVRDMSDSDIHLMLISSFMYALLELASLLVMYYVMKTKYGVSAFCQLAFVLERYWLTLQGKLVGAFIVIWNAATIHQGTDFSFEFKV